jgi:F0F1-type ATP synthase beta subunit
MAKEEVLNEFKDLQEMITLIDKLNPEQKKIVLATLRGAVLIADADKKGA